MSEFKEYKVGEKVIYHNLPYSRLFYVKAECFHCDAVVNEDREVIGKQSKSFSWPEKDSEK